MPPACSLLGMATPTPPEMQPFRFLDLPIEIRYMVYEQLRDRRVTVANPGLDLPGCVLCRLTEVLMCFRPAMLRINKQLADEYAALVMPRMILLTNWETCDHDTSHEEMHSDQAQPSMLPETTLASLQYLCLRIVMHVSTTHCDVQAAIQTLASRMLRLQLVILSTEYDIDRLVRETRVLDPAELGKHQEWTDEMVYFLQNLVDEEDSSWIAMATFQIVCALYCLLNPSAEDERIPDVFFAICEDPEEDTFKLGGLDLKSLGTGRVEVEQRAARDFNVLISSPLVQMTGKMKNE
ncbi:hypothetical protein KCU64_g15277, partial [Aureobasidium melanogenum]